MLNLKHPILLLLLMVFSTIYLSAQVEEAPPPPPPPLPKEKVVKEEPVFIDADVEEETIIEDRPVFVDQEVVEESPPVTMYNSKYRDNSTNIKFVTSALAGDYELVYERYATDRYNRTYGVLKRGEILLPIIFKSKGTHNSSITQLILALGESYGLYNLESEKWDIPLEYTSLSLLSKGMYIAKKGQKSGILDENNNIIADFNWFSISAISGLDNYVMITESNVSNSRSGIYNIISKKVTVDPQYKSIYKIQDENYFKVQNEFGEYNIIDINNKPRFKNWYTELTFARGGRKYYLVKKDDKMGVIDDKEKEIVSLDYQYIKSSPYNDGSYLARNKKGKYGCITIEGKVTLPFEYDNLEIMDYGSMAISGKGNKCGIVQVNNGLPIEIATCDFDDIAKSAKVFIVKKDGKFGIMDLYGKLKTAINYDEISPLSHDFLISRKKDQWSIMNNGGELLTDKTFLNIDRLINNENDSYSYAKKFSYLQVQHANKKYGIIDKLGNEIVGPIFEKLLSETKNIVLAKKNGKYGLYSLLSKKTNYDKASHYVQPIA